jgi:hypothetical protein
MTHDTIMANLGGFCVGLLRSLLFSSLLFS